MPEILTLLEQKRIPITEIKINPEKIKISVSQQMQSLCFQDPEMKYLGQKAFTSYMRSIYLQKLKAVFDVTKMDCAGFAQSLGLPGTPKLNFVQRPRKNELVFDLHEEPVAAKDAHGNVAVVTKIDKMFKRKNMDVLSKHYTSMLKSDSEAEDSRNTLGTNSEVDDDQFMTLKRADHGIEGLDHVPSPIPITKKEILKAKERAFKERGRGVKMVFDEAGNVPLFF